VTDRHVQAISNRLSLREPQRRSLEILARLCEIVPLAKERDLGAVLDAVKGEYPTVEEFERDFPSLCFAVATGVGKTRLMGAFIAYLYRAERIRHFFVLAPNLTIYDKLIRDFTPGSPKYVFQGLAEFATNPPEVITGDNYESGRGVRAERRIQTGLPFDPSQPIHVNIFNISKINTEVRGGAAPRIKRLSEYIGESYFEYLAGLDDLVLLMDESHRYRASAGVRAINELNPVLGLELTATPQVEAAGKAVPFKNVIYSYPLAAAMADGFVKEPAVVTRENFDPAALDTEALEQVKLEDGIRLHEHTKSELVVYANEQGKPRVKPFMLVVAQDTEHASRLKQRMESAAFFDAAYQGKVIEIHSGTKLTAEEKDENVAKLLSVEDPANPVEVVIHVNMLKEGWDVTNLYTIVPLRAANSKTLVEQSVGRGLRLPYGKRTGVSAVDRLNIVSHDRFQEIVDEARRPDSIIKVGLVIGRDIPAGRTFVHEVAPTLIPVAPAPAGPSSTEGAEQAPLFRTPREVEIAHKVVEVIHRGFGHLPTPQKLSDPAELKRLVERVELELAPAQAVIEAGEAEVSVQMIAEKTVQAYARQTIAIPRIVVVPKGGQSGRFQPFELDLRSLRPQPVEDQILIQHLRTERQERLERGESIEDEPRLENYVVRGLVDFDDIHYDETSDLLYDLAGQVVRHLESYLPDEESRRNVLRYHQKALVSEVHRQMLEHYDEGTTEFDVSVTKGFVELATCELASSEAQPRDFRAPLEDRSKIRQLTFAGFRRSLYPVEKFDSDPERRFAVILEKGDAVQKWLRPRRRVIEIDLPGGEGYISDFVVETPDRKYLCEVKSEEEMTSADVQLKAAAGALWCLRATKHAIAHGGKPWSYLLIPDSAVLENATLAALAIRYEKTV
jgi:type III restriction enzyme